MTYITAQSILLTVINWLTVNTSWGKQQQSQWYTIIAGAGLQLVSRTETLKTYSEAMLAVEPNYQILDQQK